MKLNFCIGFSKEAAAERLQLCRVGKATYLARGEKHSHLDTVTKSFNFTDLVNFNPEYSLFTEFLHLFTKKNF